MRRILKTGALLAMLAPLAACQIDEIASPNVTAASPTKPSTVGKRTETTTNSGNPKTDIGSKSRYAMAVD